MLENMFIGKPPGNYDRILDFSRAVTGNLFFVPTATFLESVPVDEPTARPRPKTRATHPVGGRWFARHRLPEDLKRGRPA